MAKLCTMKLILCTNEIEIDALLTGIFLGNSSGGKIEFSNKEGGGRILT